MTAIERVYLDTTILIMMFEGEVHERQPLIRIVAGGLYSQTSRFYTSDLTRSEVLVKPLADDDYDLVGTYDNVLTDGATLKVRSVERPILEIAAALRARQKGLKLPDAIHLATALACGCTHFLTHDVRLSGTHDFPQQPLPFVWGRSFFLQHSVQIIRPDAATLASLLAEFVE